MKIGQRRKYTKEELQAVYDEYNVCVDQLVMLKPFLKNLISVLDGAEPIYDLSGYLEKIQYNK